jgi:hypothetical protein
MGAYALHAKRDPRETTHAARAALWTRYLDEVDPDRSLPEAERVRRADAARRAHMTGLALKRRKAADKAKARSGDAPQAVDAEVDDAEPIANPAA